MDEPDKIVEFQLREPPVIEHLERVERVPEKVKPIKGQTPHTVPHTVPAAWGEGVGSHAV